LTQNHGSQKIQRALTEPTLNCQIFGTGRYFILNFLKKKLGTKGSLILEISKNPALDYLYNKIKEQPNMG
jgi:hypothetical protein